MTRTTLASMNRTLARQAQRHMTDTCRVEKPGEGDPVFNPDTGEYDDPPPVTVYEGKCRFSPLAMAEDIVESAGEQVVLKGYKVTVPRTQSGFAEGQTVIATEADDPELQGRRLRVIDVPTPSHKPVRELRCRFQHGDEDEG